MSTPIDPREEVVNGVWMYTYDPDPHDPSQPMPVDDDVREEQDNDYAAERMADIYDADDL